MVRLGKNYRTVLGYLQYHEHESNEIPPLAMAGIIIGLIIFIVFCLVIVLLYQRKSQRSERESKRIQLQLNLLENNVKLDCKKGKVYILKNYFLVNIISTKDLLMLFYSQVFTS